MSHNLNDDEQRAPDILDQATQRSMRAVDDAVAHARHEAERLKLRLGEPKGYCLFCDCETMDPTARFCDLECSEGWQREQDAKLRNGES